jgi:hypothetical protein
METALFGSVMLAVGWLVLWCCIDHSRPSKTWWPFDYCLDPAQQAKEQAGNRTSGRRISTRSQKWRASGS